MTTKKRFFESLSKAKDTTLSVVNGIIGDSLENEDNGLAITMALTDGTQSLSLTKSSLRRIGLPEGGKICILVHGNCGSERGWNFKDNPSAHYGSLLQNDFGITPFFLRYNSGLHISTNGRRLSQLLERLIRCYPTKVTEVVLIGHSMGGLILRSACHFGQKGNKEWVRRTRKIFYLGTPHLGTYWEKLGKLTATVLHKIPNLVTKVIASLGDLRSDGIKDLRHGYLVDEDWRRSDADDLFYRHKNKTPLLNSAEHYLICATLSQAADSVLGRLFGDGLVHPASGTGRGLFSSGDPSFLEDHCKILAGLAHRNLQRSPRVYQQIKAWCR